MDIVLATKLYRPRPRSGLLQRPRLLARLDRGLETALTLISAPAGFGKTTLLAQWIASTNVPAAWRSLEPADNEPERFLSYVIAALRRWTPSLGVAAGRAIPVEKVLQALNATAPYYFGRGDLLRERNRLDEAQRSLLQGMELVHEARSSFADDLLLGYRALARLYQALGDSQQAEFMVDAFMRLAATRHYLPTVIAQADALRAHLALLQGNMADAIRWAERSGLFTRDSDLSYPREREYLTLARVRLAQGQVDPAGPVLSDTIVLLARLLADAEQRGRMGSALEIRLLQALALAAQGNQKSALMTLEQALIQAAPEGYIRLFLDEGAAMLALLRQAQRRGIAPDYVGDVAGSLWRACIGPSTAP